MQTTIRKGEHFSFWPHLNFHPSHKSFTVIRSFIQFSFIVFNMFEINNEIVTKCLQINKPYGDVVINSIPQSLSLIRDY